VVGGVLAAGLGTRMRPLTHSVPKPLLPFLNTPVVTYPLQHLAQAGVQRVGFNVHHLADSVPPVVDPIAARFGLEPSYAREWERLGTAGGIASIWEALDEPENATLVVFNGDTVMNLDLRAHLQRHRENDAMVTLVGTPPEPGRPANLKLDGDAQLAGIRDARRPDVSGSVDDEDAQEADGQLRDCAFAGVHILSAEAVARLETEPGDVVDELYEPLVEAGAAIQVSEREGFWASLETPGMLMSVTRRVFDQPESFTQAPLPSAEYPEEGEGPVYRLDESVALDHVDITGPVFIGHHVEIGPDVTVGPHAVIDGATLHEGVTVRDAIVYGAGDIREDRVDCVAVADQVAALGEPVADDDEDGDDTVESDTSTSRDANRKDDGA
jgi:mannose-1-phosphate guanylyltransferase